MGFKFGTVGSSTLSLAFAVIVVWEKYSEAEDMLRQSRRGGDRLPPFQRSQRRSGEPTRAAITTYLTEVVEKEWPAIERGHADPEATAAVDATYDAVLAWSRAQSG